MGANSTETPGDTSRWLLVESDGTTFLLRHLINGQTAMVEHDGTRYVCTECGPQQGVRGSATGQCCHVRAVARRLSVADALRIAERIASPSKAVSGLSVERARLRTQAEILAAGADARAERAREHDAEFRGVTGEVTVRQATPEDMERLRLARERKARSFATPERYGVR